MRLCILSSQGVTQDEFVSFWFRAYNDPRESLYVQNIGRPLAADSVRNLFIWKNGGVLSKLKQGSIERHFISRLSELERFQGFDGRTFLRAFPAGGAIWRLFWLHICYPETYPVFDQHVYRAMTWCIDGRARELPQRDEEKVDL